MRSISFASRPISDRGLAWWAGNRSMIKCSPCSDSRQTCIATRRKYEPRHKALRNVGTDTSRRLRGWVQRRFVEPADTPGLGLNPAIIAGPTNRYYFVEPADTPGLGLNPAIIAGPTNRYYF